MSLSQNRDVDESKASEPLVDHLMSSFCEIDAPSHAIDQTVIW